MKNSLFALLFIAFSFYTFAQEKSRSRESSASLNFSGVPVLNISGTDTSYQNALSLSPVLDLRSKGGWGITYSPSITVSGQKKGIYVHSISAGYEQYGKKQFDIAFNYTRYIFTSKTNVPYSPINNEIYFSIAFTKTWLRPFLSTSIGFGKDSTGIAAHDIGLAAGASHCFSWEDKGIFSLIELTPSISLNAGTDDFFSLLTVSKYISHSHNFINLIKKGGKRKKMNATTATNKTSLELSNLELSLESNFEMGSFSIHPSGGLFFPAGSGTDNTLFGYAEITLQYHF